MGIMLTPDNHRAFAASPFYITGGTLRPDAPSYVERQADRDLYDALLRGDFCYVLHARQMGKSSLMNRTAARLRREGVAVAVLDLTAVGQNLSPEQWYDGLLALLGIALDLEDELDAFWREHERLGPLQRWMAALRQVVLAHVPGPLVLFLDEIDAVRSLPFSTDEFFAGIRECYNRRAEEPEFARLTFCLLGVASPSDLIRDTRTTPFNIGRRIELTDFTEAAATPLAAGLGRPGAEGAALLRRVLYWTGGHPYLTQRLCQAVATELSGALSTPRPLVPSQVVDRLCEELFLTPRAREQDDNLLFVRDRLLRSELDLAALLDLYDQVRRGRRVSDNESSPLVGLLRLSGIVRSDGGRLQVRNRIYERVFDLAWVQASMPDAEARRQRAAYRRGLARAGALAGIVVVVVSALALTAVRQAERARERERDVRRERYAAQMNLALNAWEAGNLGRASELVKAQTPLPGQEDLRGWEWRYLWQLCQADAPVTLSDHTDIVRTLAFSPDGRTLASAGADNQVRLWDLASHRQVATLPGTDNIWGVQFSPDGNTLAAASSMDRLVTLWDVATRRRVAVLRGHTNVVWAVAFSPDGRTLASAGDDNTIRLWNVSRARQGASDPSAAHAVLRGHRNMIRSLAFTPDGRTLASASADKTVKLWDLTSQRLVATLSGHGSEVASVLFSPDGRTLATGSVDSTIRLWQLPSRATPGGRSWPADSSTAAALRTSAILMGHADEVRSLSFSPDGTTLASASADHTLKLWDMATGQVQQTLRGHRAGVWSVGFSPDGRRLASGGGDRTVKLWNAATPQTADILRNEAIVRTVKFSPDGETLVSGGDDYLVKLWDVARRKVIAVLPGHTSIVFDVAVSPDSRTAASAGDDGLIRLWSLSPPGSLGVLAHLTKRVNSLAFSRDGKRLAAGIQDTTARLWDVGTRRPMTPLTHPDSPVFAVAFSSDGRILVTGGLDHQIRLWETTSGREGRRLTGHPNHIHYLALSPDGSLVAGGGDDATVRLWDLPTGRLIDTLRAYGEIYSADFSPDGKTLAVASGRTVTLFSLITHQEVATLLGHLSPISDLAFSPDGTLLATAGTDGTIRLWRAATFAETDAATPDR